MLVYINPSLCYAVITQLRVTHYWQIVACWFNPKDQSKIAPKSLETIELNSKSPLLKNKNIKINAPLMAD